MGILGYAEKVLIRSLLIISGAILLIASLFFWITKAGTISYGVFAVSDPAKVIVGLSLFTAAFILITFGWKFDEMNERNFQLYLRYKANQGQGRRIWLLDRSLFSAIAWGEKRRDQQAKKHWVCLIYFINVLIVAPILCALIISSIMVWLEVTNAYGVIGGLTFVTALCLVIYAWGFRNINDYIFSVFQVLTGKNNDSDVKILTKHLVFVLFFILIIIALTGNIVEKFTLAPPVVHYPMENDEILGSWSDIKDNGAYSTITFNADGSFKWSDPLISSTSFLDGNWTNTGDGFHTYSIIYFDTSTFARCTENLTLTRSYYHEYGNLVTCYPYFYFDNIPNGGPFSNPSAPQTSVPDKTTPLPPSSPAPGQDVIVGTWKNDRMQEFYMYWTFDRNGTFISSDSGNLDNTGVWKNMGDGRYSIVYPDNTGMYVDYKDGKIFNEHAPDYTSSRVSYDILDLY